MMADAVGAPPICPLMSLKCFCTTAHTQPEPESPCGRAALAARTLFVSLHREPEVPGFMSPQVQS